jgi:hypothetical protein
VGLCSELLQAKLGCAGTIAARASNSFAASAIELLNLKVALQTVVLLAPILCANSQLRAKLEGVER